LPSPPVKINRSRALALALGVPLAIGLIGYVGLYYVALVGQDSFQVHTAVTPAGDQVTVGVGSGNVSVVPSADRQAHLEGVISYSLVRPEVHWTTSPSGTMLEGVNCIWLANNCGADFTLAVPPDQGVNASSGSGNVKATGLVSRLTLYSGSGDVSIEHVSGPLDLSAGSGDITGTDVSATAVRASDDSGDVDLSFNRAPDQVRVSASSGDITVVLPANVAYAVSATTSNGTPDIGVRTSPSSHHVIDLTADSGNINVVTASQ
jgi:Putative adhesin